MFWKLEVRTGKREELVDITDRVQEIVERSGVREGICHLYVPHTTAAITVNEGADPAVGKDILYWLDKTIAREDAGYRHQEGNSAAHIKAVLTGNFQEIFIEEGRLVLGTWERIFFCEFDGPRLRKVYIKVISG
ncbi:secondary thiamine-phosphate synthase enzyme YjbQ [Calderihabitans maritimus]|uniref:Secondary thiamine-phosphate synthase enzyme n=1 Tax=Calderihabitans maritimus TaxID=1246530 RepID=A0A1Z5HXL0_9FIRM|nr:secondary thiamine-phosphate synthase enzyme YjbQ [Calderihabitans maritimus]GAW94269.1 hypothetical protein Cthe_0103 [Calderihabitans maritimus]